MKKKAGIVTAVLAAAVVALFILSDALGGKEIQRTFFAMDTLVTAKVTSADPEETTAQIEAEILALENGVISRHNPDSELAKLNGKGGEVSTELSKMLATLIDVSQKSKGAFDFALGSVSDLWGFGKKTAVPEKERLADALSHSGFEKITLSGDVLTFNDESAVIDLGASGKGAALDTAKEILRNAKAERAVISVGGSILLYGEGDFTVGIRKPDGNSGEFVATLKTKACCVSTSGNYERYFEENGVRYHHILDPKTGYPVSNGLVSVTVISENGLLSDALSTACFVLGVEEGMKLAEEYGCEAVFITENKEVYATANADSMLEINDKSYTRAVQK